MDSGTIIISAILIGIVILPFIFTGRKYRKQKKQLVKSLNGLAEQKQVRLSNYEVSGNFGIGLDQDFRYLFFTRIVMDEVSVQSVLLSEMNRCKIKTVSRLLEGGEKVIDRVEMVLYPVSSTKPEVVMEMYNTEYDTLTIRGELQTAVKWEQIIGGAIKKIRVKERKQAPSGQVVPA